MLAAHTDSSSNQNKSYVVSYDCDVTPSDVLLPNVRSKRIKTNALDFDLISLFSSNEYLYLQLDFCYSFEKPWTNFKKKKRTLCFNFLIQINVFFAYLFAVCEIFPTECDEILIFCVAVKIKQHSHAAFMVGCRVAHAMQSSTILWRPTLSTPCDQFETESKYGKFMELWFGF